MRYLIPLILLITLLTSCSDDEGFCICLCPGETPIHADLPRCPEACCEGFVTPEPPEPVCCEVCEQVCSDGQDWVHCEDECEEFCCLVDDLECVCNDTDEDEESG